jgi:hypothetical protein
MLVSTSFFIVLMLTMFIALSVETPIPFDGIGKSLLGVLVVSMLGTVVPLIISKGRK